jgi:hypothetical protein
MKGISQNKALENSIRYKKIYEKWVQGNFTLQQLGEQHNVTKQRMWQIVTRCKLGDGDYYSGVNIARNKWLEIKELHPDAEEAQIQYKHWLRGINIKIALDNHSVAPHTGVKRRRS